MKIFYAIQATGNGHISRAIDLYPHLSQIGEVDFFLSGDNCHLEMSNEIKFRSKGLSLYFNSTGGLNYWKTLRGIQPVKLQREIQALPVEKYDLVINDFEFITAAACEKKKIPSVQLGHQASFLSKHTPRPANRQAIGEWILKNYARASNYIGLHFDRYDEFILPPVIQRFIREATPVDKGHITIYLPSYSIRELENIFSRFRGYHFEIFCKETSTAIRKDNLSFYPVNKNRFCDSLIQCHGIICGAGFETPAEAIYLGKKMICIPTRGQYEQICNAVALQKLGIACIRKIDSNFANYFYQWVESGQSIQIKYDNPIPLILEKLMLHKRNFEEQQYQLQLNKQHSLLMG